MPDYAFGRGKVIDTSGGSVVRAAAIIVGAIVIIVGLWASVAYVPAGHVGVKDFFGSVSQNVLPPGISLVLPFTRVVDMLNGVALTGSRPR